jgi:hypothetical protein
MGQAVCGHLKPYRARRSPTASSRLSAPWHARHALPGWDSNVGPRVPLERVGHNLHFTRVTTFTKLPVLMTTKHENCWSAQNTVV